MQIVQVVKKGKKDVTIIFEDEKILILAVEVFIKSGLKKGDDISDDRFLFLIEQNKLFHIKQRAFKILGRRHHSSSELRSKLWQKDYDKKLIDSVINDLSENGYLNDEDFISEFVADKSRLKNWSLKKIKSELIKKGIAQKQIESILNQQTNSVEYENVKIVAKKKFEQLSKRKLEPKELRNKLSNFLFTKGFDYEMIKKVSANLINAKQDEE